MATHDDAARNGYSTCSECGKRTYPTRKTARRSAKRLYPGEHLQPYLCRSSSVTRWHVGHIAEPVVHGAVSKDELYTASTPNTES